MAKEPLAPTPYLRLANSLLNRRPNPPIDRHDVKVPMGEFRQSLAQVLKMPSKDWRPIAKEMASFGLLNLPAHKQFVLLNPTQKNEKNKGAILK